jgi:hypothetical protein
MALHRVILPIAIVWLLLQSAAVRAELVVVVNVRSGVAAMTRNEVINVFFGRNRQFFNGIEAQPVELPENHPDRARFYRLLVGKDLSEISAYWSRQVFSGRMHPPVRAASTEEVLKWIVSHPGGIGVVDLAKADARVRVVYELTP